MTYRTRTQKARAYSYFTLAATAASIIFAVYILFGIWNWLALALAFASFFARRAAGRAYASSFDSALTSRLTRDIWPGPMSPRARDRAARTKRTFS